MSKSTAQMWTDLRNVIKNTLDGANESTLTASSATDVEAINEYLSEPLANTVSVYVEDIAVLVGGITEIDEETFDHMYDEQ